MLLGEIFKNINKKYKKIKFKDIKFNSKDCKSNDIFFAIEGSNEDGKKYINNDTSGLISTANTALGGSANGTGGGYNSLPNSGYFIGEIEDYSAINEEVIKLTS